MLELTKTERRDLAAAAHSLKPIAFVGKEGLSAEQIASITEAFNTRELLKVKALENCPLDRDTLAAQLDALPGIALVRFIGKTFILYRPMPEEEPDTKPGFRKRPKPSPRKTGGA